jgi:hypothetical protein
MGTDKQNPSLKESLKAQFESIKSITKLPETRIVNLIFKTCCGCGCAHRKIQREVPYNSPLIDGDIVLNLEDDDTW